MGGGGKGYTKWKRTEPIASPKEEKKMKEGKFVVYSLKSNKNLFQKLGSRGSDKKSRLEKRANNLFATIFHEISFIIYFDTFNENTA